MHERQLMPVPESLAWAPAGGLPEVFTTAHDALFTQARPAGWASACSSTAAPAASGRRRSSSGARRAREVTATVRREELREAVAALGARP